MTGSDDNVLCAPQTAEQILSDFGGRVEWWKECAVARFGDHRALARFSAWLIAHDYQLLPIESSLCVAYAAPAVGIKRND